MVSKMQNITTIEVGRWVLARVESGCEDILLGLLENLLVHVVTESFSLVANCDHP